MNKNIIVNFGNVNQFNFNFSFFRTPHGPKRKLPVKTVLSTILGLLTLLSGGTQRQLTHGMSVQIVSPAPNSVFTIGSIVPAVARVTAPNGVKVKSLEFRANGVSLGKTETHVQ
jgi:hypothetical protein